MGLMLLGTQPPSSALGSSCCHASKVLLFYRLGAALAFALHPSLPCQSTNRTSRQPCFSSALAYDGVTCWSLLSTQLLWI